MPAGTLVFRIGRDSHLNGVALRGRVAVVGMFELSSDDKKAVPPRLSIWVESMTVADQAWRFMGGKPVNTVVACLDVDRIRAIAADPPFVTPDVEWEEARWPDGTPNADLGSEGHCGIAGLDQGGKGKMDGLRRKELRSKLTDAATISPVPVPHDIPEDHLRVAAYFIAEHGELPRGTSKAHWIVAVRQMRRSRIREYNNNLKHGK